MDWKHPTGSIPKVVDIVACGPTIRSYMAMRFEYDPIAPTPDEVWTLNKAVRTVRADLAFIMDDLVGEARRSERYRQDLECLQIPVITSTVDMQVEDLYPTLFMHGLTEYPLDEVLNQLGARVLRNRGPNLNTGDVKNVGDIVGYYLHNSIPYMLAYALFIGVERVQLYGADYTYPGMAAREDDRANTEYWIGLLRAFGVEVWTTRDTTLLNQTRQPWLYGYGARPPARKAPTVDWLAEEAARLWPGPITRDLEDTIPLQAVDT